MDELEVVESALDDVAMSIHFVGPDGTIIWANQAELKLLGYEVDEYIGQSITHFHADQAVIEDILGKLKGGATLQDYPARLRAKDGSIKHVRINSNVHWKDSEFAHTRCFTRDVTDQVRIESMVFALSAPILEIDQQLLLLPIVGVLNKDRADFITNELLNAIHRYRARAVVLDMTGAAEVDGAVLEALMSLCKCCRGLGCKVVLSGISPELAEKIVVSRVAVDEFVSVAGLRDGIRIARGKISHPERRPASLHDSQATPPRSPQRHGS